MLGKGVEASWERCSFLEAAPRASWGSGGDFIYHFPRALDNKSKKHGLGSKGLGLTANGSSDLGQVPGLLLPPQYPPLEKVQTVASSCDVVGIKWTKKWEAPGIVTDTG